jgi:hypothetical protein
MSEHTGFFHDPTSDINIICEMLAERYHLGLPVIKELIQNGDDAKAQQMVVGWAMGVPQVSNPLLRGPGVFIVNDGTFSDEDARAIKFMGQSAKVEGASIGKFGLGLKSVFHHCEAFFFLSSEYREIKRGSRIYRTRDILNPRCGEEGSPFPKWDQFNSDDQEAVIHFLQPFLPSKNWFCLWLPLRQRKHFENGLFPLFTTWEGDSNIPPNSIFLSSFEKDIGSMVPTLRHLRSIWAVFQTGQGKFENHAQISLNDGAQRMIYDGKPFDERALHGAINLSGQNESLMFFGGRENFLKDPVLGGLKGSEHWPKRSVTENGQSISKPEKADPHCAAVFTGRPVSLGHANLEISWGIFLPVSDAETREVIQGVGDWSYTLLLHGIFFVDSGRFRIEFNPPQTEGAKDPQQVVRRRWNQTLRDRGTLRLLLPALQSFVERNNLNNDRVEQLTRMLVQSEKFFDKYREEICQDYTWLRRTGKVNAWTIADANSPVYVLPRIPRDERHRPFEVFKNLEALCDQHVFTYEDLPRLDRNVSWEWSVGLLQKLLDCDVTGVFERQAYLAYLVQFLNRLGEKDQANISEHLTDMAHCAFSTVARATLRQHGFLVQEFLTFIHPSRRLVLHGEGLRAFDDVYADLLSLDIDLLLVPLALDSESKPAVGKLSWEDGQTILEVLATHTSQAKDIDALRMTLALQILNQVDDRENLLVVCGDLRLFRGFDLGQDKDVSLTLNEFQELRDAKTLFRHGQNFEGQTLPRALQQALAKVRVVLVSDQIGSLLGEERMPLCDEPACIQTLLATPALTEFKKRIPLVSRLQNWSAGSQSEEFKSGLRYLLHGRPDCLNSIYNLFAETNNQQRTVWDKLVNSALHHRETDWQLIPRLLTEQIVPALWDTLNLHEINRDCTVQLLDEVEASEIDTQTLTDEERLKAFGEIRSEDLLRALPLCKDLHGNLVSIDACDPVYLAGNFEIDPMLLSNVTVLVRLGDDELAARQERLVPVLDAKAALEIIFVHNDASEHPSSALNALAELEDRDGLPHYTQTAIRDTPWIPTRHGDPIAPGDVIYVSGVEDEIARVLATTGSIYHGIRSLNETVTKHIDYLRAFFPSVRDSIEILLMAIGEDAIFHLGGFDGQRLDKNTFMDSFKEIFADAPLSIMPAYELVCGLFQRQPNTTSDLILSTEGLFKPLTSERNIFVLEFLSIQYQKVVVKKKEAYKQMFDEYLRVATQQSDFFGYLSKIPLLNRQKVWCRPEALCLQADGVDLSVLVDEKQRDILESNVPQIGNGSVIGEGDEATIGEISIPNGGFEAVFKDGVKKLVAYFQDWEDAVPNEVVGGLLCLLGDQEEMVAFAEDYLDRGNRTLDNTRSLFDWQILPRGMEGAGEDIHTALSKQRFLIQVTEDQTVKVPNLMRDIIDVPLDRDFEHLFVGADLYFATHLGAGVRVKQLNLKSIQIASHSPIDIRRALCNSANIILSRVYVQRQADTSEVFEALSKSEQLDIRIAQDLIVDQALPYLQQLGVHKEPNIRGTVQEWHAARRSAAEERQQEGDSASHSVAGDQAIQKVKHRFVELLRNDEDVRKDILKALRIRMDNHYQYKPYSVPFELFQNADDAVVELRGMGAEIGSTTDRFVIFVDKRKMVLAFLHYGRLINQFRLGEFNGRDIGYDRDLEKMLVVSASDKGDQEVGETVTGKFGLGFKSVFLISDIPKVFSGPMAFEVIGGMLPIPISDRPALIERHDRKSTFFELQLRNENQDIECIMDRFERLSGILLAFARAIQHIDLDIDGNTHTISWNGESVQGVDGASVGTLMPFSHRGEARQRALMLRKTEGALLLGLCATGFEMLDRAVPALWVTTPMRQATGYGFAINGPFEVDVGRAQVASESIENDRLQAEMGKDFGQMLCSLYDASESWTSFCQDLNLAEDTHHYDFWCSFWSVVGLLPLSHLAVEASSEALFIRDILWAEGRGGANLFTTRNACPTGLWGKHQVLTGLNRIQVEVRGCLETEDVFLKVANWPEVLRQMEPGEGVSYSQVSQPLNRLMGRQGWRSVWLADLFEENQKIDSKAARRLGAVIDDKFVNDLEEAEQERLEELLGTFRFIGRDGVYHRGDNLLIPHDTTYEYRDEGMRAAFAPSDRVLSDGYAGVSLSFFKACRKILNAKAVDMAKWVFDADEERIRKTVLNYLLLGELDSELARELRSNLSGTWLESLPGSPLLEDYSEQERGQLLGILWLGQPTPGPVVGDKYSDPQVVLPRIYNKWQEIKDEKIAEYYKITYPGGTPPELNDMGLRKDVACRRDWLLVFMLGVVQKLGRAKPEAHRNFLAQCLQDGDLDVFADPSAGPDKWMDILQGFLDKEGEFITYFHWMTQFTGFFQLAKWLHHYGESFLSADRLGGKFALNHLLAPRTNPSFQGGGPDAPTIVRTLGIGAHFVVRELFRQGIITEPYVHPHCYMPVLRVRRLFELLGCQFHEWERENWSEQIHGFLVDHLGKTKATFDEAFDIPFQIIARDADLQDELFGGEVVDVDEEDIDEDG